MDLEQFEHSITAMPNLLVDRLASAERKTNEDLRSLVLRLSNGPFSSEDLAAMGHPYARRNPRPPLHPGVINIQTGLFMRNWRGSQTVSADNIETKQENFAPYAGFLDQGTSKMIARPLPDLALSTIAPIRRQNILDALQDVFK